MIKKSKCYTCDAAAVGFRDRRPEGGKIELACKRHTDPYLMVILEAMKKLHKKKKSHGKKKRMYSSHPRRY